jgi:SAM-dependent methyltransferase
VWREVVVKQSSGSIPEHGLVIEQSDLTMHQHCPVCGSGALRESESIRFRKGALRYDQCANCELMFMNPMPSQDWYNRFNAEIFWEAKGVNAGVEEIDLQEKQLLKELHRAQVLLRFLADNDCLPPRGARVLEIGCAFGFIGRSIAARLDGVSFGVEPSVRASAVAKKHIGVNVVARNTDELTQWEPDVAVDLVIFSHVLENIVDPLATLSQVHRVLGSGGLLMLETPNPVFQQATSIYHPFVYSSRAIKHLVARAGFSIKAYETNGLPRNRLVPRFQRLVAVKVNRNDDRLPLPRPGIVPFPLRRRLGLSFWKIGKSFRRKGSIDEVAQRLFNIAKSSIREDKDGAKAGGE